MKFVWPLITFMFIQNVFAGPSTTTEHGYKKDFCGEDAKRMVKSLDDQNVASLNRIKKVQLDINQLNAKKTIIKGFLDLRNDFLSSFDQISKKYSGDEKAYLDNFKKLLRSSLTLQAISLIETEQDDPKSGDKTPIERKCYSEKNKSTEFCKYVTSWTTFKGASIGALNQSLSNYLTAKEQLPTAEQEKIKIQFQSIMATIPDSISPSAVINTILQKSPNVADVLGADIKNDIEKCFKDDKESEAVCKNLIRDDSKRANLSQLFSSELKNVSSEFIQAKSHFDNEQLDSIFANASKTHENKKGEIQKVMAQKIDEALNQFNDEESKKKLAEMGISDSTLANFKSYCTDSSPDSKAKCSSLSQQLIHFFEDKNKEIDAAIAAKTDELNSMTSTGSGIAQTLKLRQYVLQKYVRTCTNASIRDFDEPTAICDLAQNRSPASSGDPSLNGLIGNLSGVVSRLIADNKISKQRGELGAFSKDELKVYEGHCSNTTAQKKFPDICSEVFKDSNAIKNYRETKDWEQFHKDYWVIYSNNEKGYEVYYKKSNARIFGEGLSQSVSRIYPTWLTNMNLKYQIDNAENQAMFMKQLNYMYSPTSPWMQNSYFGGSYYSFPTTMNLSSPFSTSAGFNFTK